MHKMTTNTVTSSQHIPQTSWRTPIAASALALVLVLGFASQNAVALTLGPVNVLSAMGEPLRIEIDVPEITAEEAASLRTTIANPQAFRAAGLEYNPALSSAQISLQRRANGTAYLRMSSDRVINEPFVDLILEATWSSGRIVRDYTMLFDPANLRQAAAPNVTASTAPAPTPATSSSPNAPVAAAARANNSESMPKPAGKPAPKDGITVKPGDTAAALAARYKPAGVSLDQMLVAMLNTSLDAFIGSNVNRLKSGAVIDMQAASAAAPGTSEAQAKETIVAQSKDFNEFRRRLASGAPTTTAAAPSRAAGGKVQANVSEPRAAATAPDKLTLSRGSVAAKAKEEAIAKEKQAKDNATRVAELSKNISDLNKISTATPAKPGAPAAAPATGAASALGMKVAGSAPPVVPLAPTAVMDKTPTPTVAAPTLIAASAAESAAAPVAPAASEPTPAPAVVVKPKAPPRPPPQPTFMERLLGNPIVLPGAGVLLAGLGGLAFWRMRQRKKAMQADSSFLRSSL
jgi:pilus assembly protein FimV